MREFLEKLILAFHGLQILDQLVFRLLVRLFIDGDQLADPESAAHQTIQMK